MLAAGVFRFRAAAMICCKIFEVLSMKRPIWFVLSVTVAMVITAVSLSRSTISTRLLMSPLLDEVASAK